MVRLKEELKKEEKRIRKEWKNIIFNLFFVLLNLFIVIIFYKKILSTTILLLILAVIGLVKWKSKLTTAIFFFGFGGAFIEIIAIYFGVWEYSLTNFYNIPFWLFILWGNTAAFIYQTALEFRKLGVKAT
ncbi:hypothetical protein COV16_04385 [Candidatus Woesearchaeota archaeon CG10_big_fil_rev_8_21_14_0_10_34_8]|nr:MAG: hypothetical protein COV16_04385 [Candidatus Woesearchaeota archaeon CG10_big_fil_rev_8_21_14_0_10_34_8]